MSGRSRASICLLALALGACTSARTDSAGTPGRDSRPHRSPSHHHSAHRSSRAPSDSPATTSAGSTSEPAAPTTSAQTPSGTTPMQVLDGLTLPQRVGQLLMVDCPSTGVAAATVTAIRSYHVGSVILDGTTTEGVAGAAHVTAQLRALAPPHLGLFISTDQEGGEVQRLQGTGFSAIPSAVTQGRWTPSHLRQEANGWAGQLRHAGVDVNLAPVLDTVPADFGSNPPIGDLDREYGHRPVRVARHGLAYANGMLDAGVAVTAKHFPGLGRVHGNTDTTSGVTDDVTTRHDPYLRPFRDAVTDHVPFVMISTAIYSKIDPGIPAAFSHTVVTGMLRGDLGYRGVVVSDDLGAAAQVAGVPVGERAVRFVAAGGDVVLTVEAGQAAAMTHALVRKARSSRAFRRLVDAAALRVLTAKQQYGLLR